MKEEAGESGAGGAAAGASGGKRTGAAAEKACLYSRTTCHSIRGSGECALTRLARYVPVGLDCARRRRLLVVLTVVFCLLLLMLLILVLIRSLRIQASNG